MFRPSRESTMARFYATRALLLMVGAAVGLIGMLRELTWLVWIGIGILLVAVVLRVIASRSRLPN